MVGSMVMGCRCCQAASVMATLTRSCMHMGRSLPIPQIHFFVISSSSVGSLSINHSYHRSRHFRHSLPNSILLSSPFLPLQDVNAVQWSASDADRALRVVRLSSAVLPTPSSAEHRRRRPRRTWWSRRRSGERTADPTGVDPRAAYKT